MKRSIRFSLLCVGVCALLPVTGAFAQDTATPAATPSVAVPPSAPAPATGPALGGKEKGEGRMKAALAVLTPEEKRQFFAARKKAMADPAVQEAKANKASDRKGFHRAMHDAMLKADPSIQPILDKMREANGGGHMKRKDLQTN